jgi:hypothetical protein
MKRIAHLILCIALCWQFPVFGQKISDDSLMKQANLEVYNNPDKAISIGKNLLQRRKTSIKQLKFI